MNKDKFKQYLIIIGFTFPLSLLTAFFTLITFNIPFANPLMFILLIGLIFIYYFVIRLRISSIAYGNYLETSTQRRRVIYFVIDIVLASMTLVRKSYVLALIIVLIWLAISSVLSLNKPGKSKDKINRNPNRDKNVIDIDEEGNIIE